MIAEQIIALVVIGIVSLIMIIIGISMMRSLDPTGFYTFRKPPKAENLSDVSTYNRKHGMMFILYGVGILISYIIEVIISSATEFPYILSGTIFLGLVVLCLNHEYLDKKYIRKN